MVKINKNRNRSNYTFANINLLGICNANCYFCLGKDIPELLTQHNQLNTHFTGWKNFGLFLDNCDAEGITKLYLTGQNCDSLQYRYFDQLIDYVQNRGFTLGIRTNGYLAKSKIKSINKCYDEIGYSIHSLDPETNFNILERHDIPDWEYILNNSGDNVRVSIVLNRYNLGEFYDLVDYISKFNRVKYIQVRRISTDKREDELQLDVDLFEQFYENFKLINKQVGDFKLGQKYQINGKEIVFWRTVETTANSLNYFTDGTISDNYFIVEGYEQNYNINL